MDVAWDPVSVPDLAGYEPRPFDETLQYSELVAERENFGSSLSRAGRPPCPANR